MIRADLRLLKLGLATSRTVAQNLIGSGRVSIHLHGQWQLLSKPGLKVPVDFDGFQVAADAADRYVSRGGLKMAGALARSGLAVNGLTVLDVGQSTGGFTDCLLQAGALRVVGVDVGHAQLVPSLRADPRVKCFEGVNARALAHGQLLSANQEQPFDLIVCDVSFISLHLVLPSALPLLAPGGALLSLVKPQFEVGRDGVGKGGIVRDPARYPVVRDNISQLVQANGLDVLDWFDSPITGGDGNLEFFIFARRPG